MLPHLGDACMAEAAADGPVGKLRGLRLRPPLCVAAGPRPAGGDGMRSWVGTRVVCKIRP